MRLDTREGRLAVRESLPAPTLRTARVESFGSRYVTASVLRSNLRQTVSESSGFPNFQHLQPG
jgi:hypothetical protein